MGQNTEGQVLPVAWKEPLFPPCARTLATSKQTIYSYKRKCWNALFSPRVKRRRNIKCCGKRCIKLLQTGCCLNIYNWFKGTVPACSGARISRLTRGPLNLMGKPPSVQIILCPLYHMKKSLSEKRRLNNWYVSLSLQVWQTDIPVCGKGKERQKWWRKNTLWSRSFSLEILKE